MKKVIVFLVFLVSFQMMGQTLKSVEVKGRIIVEKSDVEGIVVINKTSNSTTVTNQTGAFTLEVSLNDVIEVLALQYKNISFNVNEAVIRSKVLKIYLIEEINQLDEIIVTNNKLTGNLAQDIKTNIPFELKKDAFYFGIPNKFSVMNSNSATLNTVALDPSHNIAMNPERLAMINGLDIINVVDLVLLPLFRAEVKNKKSAGIPEVPVETIKYYFGSDFLVSNFNIPEYRVEEFIRYVENENFDFNLLNYGHEMEFLDLLNRKSIEFLKEKSN